MSCRGPGAALALTLALAGCGTTGARWERVAVLPFENVSGDSGVDWAGRGVAEALCLNVAGAAQVHAFRVGSLREAPGVRATQMLHGYVWRAGAGLRAEAVLEDVASGRMRKRLSAAGETVAPLAQALAAGLAWPARAFGASRDAALRAYVAGLSGSKTRDAADAFQGAVALEADFGAAYVAWAQRLAAAGDGAGARQAIARAGERGERIPALERARLGVLGAALGGDPAARHRAGRALAQAAPAEADVFEHLAELEVALCRYRDAVKSYEQATARDPQQALLYNQLGYARCFARDLAGAVASLQSYRELRPEEANPLDSLGDVHYYLGRFAEAEKYYLEAWRKDPGFLSGEEPYKVAWARLMQGNRGGADEQFEKYLEARRASGDALVELRRAQWEYLTGRQREAQARLEGRGGVAAWVQLAVWGLAEGNRNGAREWAARAAAAARDPASVRMARLTQYLAGEEAGVEAWAARAQRAFLEGTESGLRRTALAYALLLARDYAAALPLLKDLHASTPPSANEPINVLLAWALVETGRAREASELLNWYPVPQPGGEQPFACLTFPRVLRLRAQTGQPAARP